MAAENHEDDENVTDKPPDVQAAVERLKAFMDMTWTDYDCLRLHEDIRTVIAALAAVPRWRDAPTGVGWWVTWYQNANQPDDFATYEVSEEDVAAKICSEWDGAPVFGPLPLPPERKDGES